MGTSFGFAMEMTGTRWFFPVNLQAFKGNRTRPKRLGISLHVQVNTGIAILS